MMTNIIKLSDYRKKNNKRLYFNKSACTDPLYDAVYDAIWDKNNLGPDNLYQDKCPQSAYKDSTIAQKEDLVHKLARNRMKDVFNLLGRGMDEL